MRPPTKPALAIGEKASREVHRRQSSLRVRYLGVGRLEIAVDNALLEEQMLRTELSAVGGVNGRT